MLACFSAKPREKSGAALRFAADDGGLGHRLCSLRVSLSGASGHAAPGALGRRARSSFFFFGGGDGRGWRGGWSCD